MKLTKKKKATTDHKLSLGEYIWFGFNFTCGIAFVSAYYTLLTSSSTGIGGLNLGYHLIWILGVEGLIAGTCAWAFARLSRIHPYSDGASYVYARTNVNKFSGWAMSLCIYMTLPLIITSQIVSMIRLNFITGSFEVHWGAYRDLWLDLIGITIYGISCCGIYLGFRIFKKIFKGVVFVKWGLSLILIIAAIALIIQTKGHNFSNVKSELSASSFSNAFASCFFFFLGFETFSTMNKNVKDPEKNVPKGIVLIMLIVTLVMMVVTALFIGALVSFQSNPAIQIFHSLGEKAGTPGIGTAGGILMVACFISIKASAGMGNSLYSSSILQPLAKEGFIPEKLGVLTEDNLAKKAITVNLIITGILLVFWLIIPDLIYGSIYGENSTKLSGKSFTYTDITSIVSALDLMVYIFIVGLAVKLSIQKTMKSKNWEIVSWALLGCFLIWQFIEFWIKVIKLYTVAGGGEIVKPTIQIIYFLMLIGVCLGWYYFYYIPKFKKRKLENPEIQKQLDAEFHIVDDWKFVAKYIEDELNDYILRSKHVLKDQPISKEELESINKNSNIAKELRKTIIEYEGDLKSS